MNRTLKIKLSDFIKQRESDNGKGVECFPSDSIGNEIDTRAPFVLNHNASQS